MKQTKVERIQLNLARQIAVALREMNIQDDEQAIGNFMQEVNIEVSTILGLS